MAEAILIVVSKIGALVLNEEVSAVTEKLSRKVTGLKELPAKIRRIGEELKMMNDAIQDFQDLSTTYYLSDRVKGWIAFVTEVAYHVEDVIDKYSYEALKLKEEGLHGCLFGGSRHIKVFSKIADEVVEIETQIRHLEEMHPKSFKNETLRGRFPELVVNDEHLVGIDENMSKLTEWLTTDETESTVISVSGMGGLGKTTLVKNVYDREKANFPDAHAWIVVSQAYDVAGLLANLLAQIRHPQQLPSAVGVDVDDPANVYDLREAIQKILQDRKCLIVLDDVWGQEAYAQISSAFLGIQGGGRIIMTTRNEDVAALAPQGRRLLLQPLGSVESFKLFCSRAFHNRLDSKCPLELETVAAAIVNRCHGLPLLIVFSGSLLSMKVPTVPHWNRMYDYLWIELWENDSAQAILNRTYLDLLGDLRNCFLYCTLFPLGHPIPRESLVRLWVAEGLVMKRDDRTPEEVAEGNLMELIGRNMLEVVERDELSRVSTCKIMHAIVRELALAVAIKERFGSANDRGEMMLMDRKLREVRWFSTCGWSDSNKTAPEGAEFPRLRTFVSIGSSSNMLSSLFSSSIYLTVLELQDSPINQVPASIGNLFNLRYIGLRRTQVQSLPETIDKLSNLETLDLKHTRIEKLPPVIVKVKKLRHLFADRYADEKQAEFRYCVGVEAPMMISNFQELQTLETVHASRELSVQLKKMSKLQTVCVDNIDASNCEELFDALSDMPILSSLLLSASHEDETLSFEDLGQLYNRLDRLIIRGGRARGSLERPIFQGHESNIKYLALSWCDLETTEDLLHLLASHLWVLTYLSLNRVRSKGILVLPAGCFPRLKTLVLKRMPNVKKLVVEEGAIGRINGIYIMTLLGLNAVPHGIESLGSLKKLWMLDVHTEFKADWTRNQMHTKMMHVPDLRV